MTEDEESVLLRQVEQKMLRGSIKLEHVVSRLQAKNSSWSLDEEQAKRLISLVRRRWRWGQKAEEVAELRGRRAVQLDRAINASFARGNFVAMASLMEREAALLALDVEMGVPMTASIESFDPYPSELPDNTESAS